MISKFKSLTGQVRLVGGWEKKWLSGLKYNPDHIRGRPTKLK